MSELIKEIERRKTFGIISHPDAGKTTLTEKLLLFGGAIQEAGAVKSNKIKKGATSDFMEIERQRGISVATSVLAFEYRNHKINILDTPGHKDFAEDTYRTLTAVDSVIVVIDVAKGVEEQTEKLVKVCRMRNIPMLVFINKLDREGKDAFDLLDEVEQKLGLTVCPLSLPIGMGGAFQGIYNIWENNIQLFLEEKKQKVGEAIKFDDINDTKIDDVIGEKAAATLREELELVQSVYPEFNREDYMNGDLQPVFFGLARKIDRVVRRESVGNAVPFLTLYLATRRHRSDDDLQASSLGCRCVIDSDRIRNIHMRVTRGFPRLALRQGQARSDSANVDIESDIGEFGGDEGRQPRRRE